MAAKLDKIHEMYKLLNEKERVNHDIMSTFWTFRAVPDPPSAWFGEAAGHFCLAADHLAVPVPLQRRKHLRHVSQGLPLVGRDGQELLLPHDGARDNGLAHVVASHVRPLLRHPP